MHVPSWHDWDPGNEVRNHDHQLMVSNSAEHRQHGLIHTDLMQFAAAVHHGSDIAALGMPVHHLLDGAAAVG